MRIAFVGGGVMAEAMVSRALSAGVAAASDVCIAEPIDGRRAYLADTYKVTVTADNADAVDGAALVVIAVKPQHFGDAASVLKGKLKADQTVVSIIAGMPIKRITDDLKHPSVVRVMPNMPAQIGAGVSVWTATESVSEDAGRAAAGLLGVLGREWQVADEGYLDMATAVSGSGPAYVFAFIEALIEAGVYLGMPRDMARALTVDTVVGSARLTQETGENPAVLREMVTSPGGTTAAGLRELERGSLRATVLEAVVAAHRRARELGGNA